jgi:hypothetical protein
MARVTCNSNNNIFKFDMVNFLRKRDCACKCSNLKVEFPTLHYHDACVDACNVNNQADRPKNGMDWLCKNVGGEATWSASGREYCGFDSTQTKAAQTAKDVQTKIDKQTDSQMSITKWAGILGAIIILGIFIKRILK